MPDSPSIEKTRDLIHKNPQVFSKIFSLVLLLFGILVVIGAIKDWDWLYAPDKSYHSWWNLSQVSRYLGRGTARILGSIGGLVIIAAGIAWCYAVYFKK